MKKLILLLTIISHFAFGQNNSPQYNSTTKTTTQSTGVTPKAKVWSATDTASGKSPVFLFETNRIKYKNATVSTDTSKFKYLQARSGDSTSWVLYKDFGFAGGSSTIDSNKVFQVQQGRGSTPAFAYFNGIAWVMNDTSYIPRTGANNITGNLLYYPSATTRFVGIGDGIISQNAHISFQDNGTSKTVTQYTSSSSGFESKVQSVSTSTESLTFNQVYNPNTGQVKGILLDTRLPVKIYGDYAIGDSVYRDNDSLRYIQLKDAQERFAPIGSGLSDTLPDGKIYIGDATNTAFPRDLSKDVTINNLGEVTISDNAVTTAKITDANVTTAKIADLTSLGFLAQSTSPTPYVFGTKGTKIYADSAGKMASVRTNGKSTISLNEDDLTNIVGTIVNDKFNRPNSSTMGYTLVGSHLTQALSSDTGRLYNATGDVTWTQYLDVGINSWDDKCDFSLDFTIPTKSAGNAFGIGILQVNNNTSVNTYGGFGLAMDASGTGTDGTFTYQTFVGTTGVATVVTTNATKLTYSVNQPLRLTIHRSHITLQFTLQNLATGQNLLITTSNVGSSSDRPIIVNFGGSLYMSNIKFTSYDKKNPQLLLCGDSNFENSALATVSNPRTLTSLLNNTVNAGCQSYAAFGCGINTLYNNLKGVYLRKPRYAIIHMGINNAPSMSVVTYKTYMDGILSKLDSNGIIPVICTPVPGLAGCSKNVRIAQYDSLVNTYTNRIVIDLASAMSTAGALQTQYWYGAVGDSVHWSLAGHQKAYSTIMSNPKLNINAEFYPFYTGFSSTSSNINEYPSFSANNSNSVQGDLVTTFNYAALGVSAGNATLSGGIVASYNNNSYSNAITVGSSSDHPTVLLTNNLPRATISKEGNTVLNQSSQSATNTQLTITQAVHTGGSPSVISAVAANHTTLTASTEAIPFKFFGGSPQYATGTKSFQRSFSIFPQTLNFVGASSVTSTYNAYIGGANVAGTNASIGVSGSLLINSNNVGSGVSSSYGLNCIAPTGAASNYSAIFQGGNVGIGLTAPVALLHLGASTTSVASLRIESGTKPTSPASGDIWLNSSTNSLETNINGINLTMGASVGQTTLVAGTKAVTITGITSASKVVVTRNAQGGTVTTTVIYEATCSANTLTINARVAAGTTNTSDTSIISYIVYP
jgi:hypothetical protein